MDIEMIASLGLGRADQPMVQRLKSKSKSLIVGSRSRAACKAAKLKLLA